MPTFDYPTTQYPSTCAICPASLTKVIEMLDLEAQLIQDRDSRFVQAEADLPLWGTP